MFIIWGDRFMNKGVLKSKCYLNKSIFDMHFHDLFVNQIVTAHSPIVRIISLFGMFFLSIVLDYLSKQSLTAEKIHRFL